LYLTPGSYRIGALMPVSGANPIVSDPTIFTVAQGVSFVGFLRQLGSPTLAMPNVGPPYQDAAWFGPTFTFTLGPPPPPGPIGNLVVPVAYAFKYGTTALNTLLRNTGAPRTYQMQFSAAALAGLPVGAKITELRFRLGDNVSAFPINRVTWSDYQVILARAAQPISAMTTNFDANMVAPVVVKSGALSLGANAFPTNGPVNPFASFLVFDTPYVYQGGDLVMLFRHPGSDSSSTSFLDGLTTTTSGYGTDFRAYSTNSFTAPNGLPSAVTIPQIVFTYSPLQTIAFSGTDLVITVAGGPPGGDYHLMTSTNLAAPISEWIPVATGRFDAGGGFRYTNSINDGSPTRFFNITLP